jgi:hypothetical protein
VRRKLLGGGGGEGKRGSAGGYDRRQRREEREEREERERGEREGEREREKEREKEREREKREEKTEEREERDGAHGIISGVWWASTRQSALHRRAVHTKRTRSQAEPTTLLQNLDNLVWLQGCKRRPEASLALASPRLIRDFRLFVHICRFPGSSRVYRWRHRASSMSLDDIIANATSRMQHRR